MQRHAQTMLASNVLRKAAAQQPVPAPVPRPAEDSSTADAATPLKPANSNDLLPMARGNGGVPNANGGATPMRKRRRVRTSTGGAISGGNVGPQKETFLSPRPSIRLADIGGIDSVLHDVRELVEWPLRHRELYDHLGVDPPRGLLLHGPPGCGKTMLALAVAGELDVALLKVSAPEIVTGMSGESERRVRDLFAEAKRMEPSIVFIDEIDTIASRKEDAGKDMSRRIVAQLLTCIDELATLTSDEAESGQATDVRLDPATDVDKQDRQRQTSSTRSYLPGEASPDIPMPSDVTGLSDSAEHAAQQQDGDNAHDDGTTSLGAGVVDNTRNRQDAGGFSRTPAVMVIAATNCPEVIEPSLRRAGRFDRELRLGAPDDEARAAILRKLCRHVRVAPDCDFGLLAKKTAGYVGADLALLLKEAGMLSIRRFGLSEIVGCEPNANRPTVSAMDIDRSRSDNVPCSNETLPSENASHSTKALNTLGDRQQPFTPAELVGFTVTTDDFLGAIERVQPSALREGFATRPDVSWNDVGALEHIREELKMAVVDPIRHPERYSALGLSTPAGVLLYGPPGCGKTLLARAVASESGANFISVKGPELLSRYVGDSELAVRKLFSRAQASAPCIVFFDELDALAPRRGGTVGNGASSASGGASERVVNMLLTEMDGFETRKKVFLIAATNRPDIIDPAMLRPGRLDKLLYVPLPTADGRVGILQTLLRRVVLASDVDVHALAYDTRCDGFTGADLQALIRAAGEAALRRLAVSLDPTLSDTETQMESDATACITPQICRSDFATALDKVCPSVNPRDAKLYKSLESSLRASRARQPAAPAAHESKDATAGLP